MSSQAHWSDDDIDILINYLWEERTSAGNGMTFKRNVWNEAAKQVNAAPNRRGGEKTWGSCKSKWAKLKETFYIVADIKLQSGFTWSDEFGANIHEESAALWEAYEKKHPGSAPFRNKGWKWFDRIQPLMPSSPRGANVYRPSSGSQQLSSGTTEDSDMLESQSQEVPFSEWDESLPSSQTSGLPPAASSSKHPHQSNSRTSGAHALHGMNERLDDFTTMFREVMAGERSSLEATPVQKIRAMKLAQELEPSDDCVVQLVDLFQADVGNADAYTSFTREGVRKKWVVEHTGIVEDLEQTNNS